MLALLFVTRDFLMMIDPMTLLLLFFAFVTVAAFLHFLSLVVPKTSQIPLPSGLPPLEHEFSGFPQPLIEEPRDTEEEEEEAEHEQVYSGLTSTRIPEAARVDYDVVVDIPQLSQIDFPIFARDPETLQAYERGFQGKTVVAWGTYNTGKTFILGRIFGVKFCSESLTERTKALSYKRFEYGNTRNRFFLAIDCAGNSTPTNANEEMVLLDKFATEKFLHEFAYLSSDYILLAFDCGSWDNTQKILYHRRRAYKNKEQKEIFIVFNWKLAKTAATIESLVQEEVVQTYQSAGNLQLDEFGNSDFFHLPRNTQKELAAAKIFWFGDDREPESRAHNDRAATKMFDLIKNLEVFKEVQPLQVFYREVGVKNVSETTAPAPPPYTRVALSPSPAPARVAPSSAEDFDYILPVPPSPSASPSPSTAEGGLVTSSPAPTPTILASSTKYVPSFIPLLFGCYEGASPHVELQLVTQANGEGRRTPECPHNLSLLKKVVCRGTQKMRGELRFERDHLRFTEHDINPEIFVSSATEYNQPLLKVYVFSFPGLKPMSSSSSSSSLSKPEQRRGSGAMEPNTFSIKALKKGYAFEVQVTHGVPFHGLGMTSQTSLNSPVNNTSSGFFDLGGDYVMKFSDFMRGILHVWVLKVDEQGSIVEEAEQQLESLRASLLRSNDLVLDSVPEGAFNEFK